MLSSGRFSPSSPQPVCGAWGFPPTSVQSHTERKPIQRQKQSDIMFEDASRPSSAPGSRKQRRRQLRRDNSGDRRVEIEQSIEEVDDAMLFTKTSPFPGMYTPPPMLGRSTGRSGSRLFGSLSARGAAATPSSYAQKFVDAAFCGELSRLTKEMDHLKTPGKDQSMKTGGPASGLAVTVPDAEDEAQDHNLWLAYSKLKQEMELVVSENTRLKAEAVKREALYQDEFAAIAELKQRMEQSRATNMPNLEDAYSVDDAAAAGATGGKPAVRVNSHGFELKFQKGCAVEARRARGGRWYVGTLVAVNAEDGTVDIEFANGDVDVGVPRGAVRARIQPASDVRKSFSRQPLVATVHDHRLCRENDDGDDEGGEGEEGDGGGWASSKGERSAGGLADLAEFSDNEITLLLHLDRAKSQHRALVQELHGARSELTACFETIRDQQQTHKQLSKRLAKSAQKVSDMQLLLKTAKRERDVAKRHVKIFSMSVESRVVQHWKGALSGGGSGGGSGAGSGGGNGAGMRVATGTAVGDAGAGAANEAAGTDGGALVLSPTSQSRAAIAGLQPPPRWWFQITGAGAAMINGAYHLDRAAGAAASDGAPRYKRVGADIYLCRVSTSRKTGRGRWVVSYLGPNGEDALSRRSTRPSRIWQAPAQRLVQQQQHGGAGANAGEEAVPDADFYSVIGVPRRTKGGTSTAIREKSGEGQGAEEEDKDKEYGVPPTHGWQVEELGVQPTPTVTRMPMEALAS